MCMYDILWYNMIYYDILLFTMVYYDILWYTMIYYFILWHTMTYYDILWLYVIKHHILELPISGERDRERERGRGRGGERGGGGEERERERSQCPSAPGCTRTVWHCDLLFLTGVLSHPTPRHGGCCGKRRRAAWLGSSRARWQAWGPIKVEGGGWPTTKRSQCLAGERSQRVQRRRVRYLPGPTAAAHS